MWGWVCNSLFPSFFMIFHPYIPFIWEKWFFSTYSSNFSQYLQDLTKTLFNYEILRTRMSNWALSLNAREREEGMATLKHGVVHCLLWKFAWFDLVMCSEKIKFALCRCTPLPTVDMFCEKIKVIHRSINMLGRLLKNKKNNMMTRKIWNRVWRILVHRNEGYEPSGHCVAREGAASDIDRVFLGRQVAFREFGYVLSTDHVRLHPCHPYIDCLLTVWYVILCLYA